MDWLTHLGNHRLTALWRLHEVHHSQEELSILTTYRAHPLVHVSFLLSAVPVLAIEDNSATPAVVLTIYACLGALPLLVTRHLLVVLGAAALMAGTMVGFLLARTVGDIRLQADVLVRAGLYRAGG